MSQRVSNIYSLITIPSFYKGLQALLGSAQARDRFAKEIICAEPGSHVLDVGCGPGSLLPHLPDVRYVGIDLNEKHIQSARAQMGERGQFYVGNATNLDVERFRSFDLILIVGVLHHLSDAESRSLFASLLRLIKVGGRVVTMDNVWLPGQRIVAKVLNGLDSGLNIRRPDQYERLIDGLPFKIETCLYNDLLRVPYDHFCMTLTSKS